MIQSAGFLGRLLGPLLKTGLPLMKNVIKPLAKSVLIPLGLTAAASAADAGIHKKILGPGHQNKSLIISNDEMEDIIKIVKSLEDSGLLLKEVGETIPNEAKEQKEGFLSLLGESLLRNTLADKGMNRPGEEATAKRQGWGVIRAGDGAATKKQGRRVLKAGHKNKIDF